MAKSKHSMKSRKERPIAELVAQVRHLEAKGNEISNRSEAAHQRSLKELPPHKSIRWTKITGKDHRGHHPDLKDTDTTFAHEDYISPHYILGGIQHSASDKDIERLERLTAMYGPEGYDLTFRCKLAIQIQIGRREIAESARRLRVT